MKTCASCGKQTPVRLCRKCAAIYAKRVIVG